MPRYYIAKICTFIGLAAACFCLYQLWGDGWDHPSKVWFALLIVSVVITLVSAVCARYYRGQAAETNADKIGLETLNNLAEQQKRSRRQP